MIVNNLMSTLYVIRNKQVYLGKFQKQLTIRKTAGKLSTSR